MLKAYAAKGYCCNIKERLMKIVRNILIIIAAVLAFTGCMNVEESGSDIHNITFDKNNASATGTMASQGIVEGTTSLLNSCVYTMTDRWFLGWATNSTGGVVYSNKQEYTMGTADLTLYAVWSEGFPASAFGGGDGVVSANNATGTYPTAADYGWGIAVDSAGNVYVAGSSENSSLNGDMALWKFTSDGVLDTTFGGGDGIVTHNNAAGGDGHDSGNAIFVDGSGNIYIAGQSLGSGSNDADMVIWKYTSAGVLDGTFGNGGIVTNNSAAGGDYNDCASSIYVDGSGNVFVAGWSARVVGDQEMTVWKYTSAGVLSGTFGGGDGIFTNGSAAGSAGNDYGKSLAVDASGNIYVCGHSVNSSGNYDMVIWKLTSAGVLDASFGGGDGIVTHHNAAGGNSSDQSACIKLDSTGNIYVIGQSQNSSGNADLVIWKYTAAGVLDSTFGNGGVIVKDGIAGGNGNDAGMSLALASDGKIVATGWSLDASGDSCMVVLRFNADGTPDTTFGNQGVIIRKGAAGGSGDEGCSVYVDDSGAIFVAGDSKNSADNADVTVWKFEN